MYEKFVQLFYTNEEQTKGNIRDSLDWHFYMHRVETEGHSTIQGAEEDEEEICPALEKYSGGCRGGQRGDLS
jgi:hypothetical protein